MRWLASLVLVISFGIAVDSGTAAAAGVGETSPPVWLPFRDPVNVTCAEAPCDRVVFFANMTFPGAPVFAAGAGQVTVLASGSGCTADRTPVNAVRIDHGDGLESFYQGLGTLAVSTGQWVDETTLIGTLGTQAECPDLDLEIRGGGTALLPLPPLSACHGLVRVVYPDVLADDWWSASETPVYSDGVGCGATADDADDDGIVDAHDGCPDSAGREADGGCPSVYGLTTSPVAVGDFDGDGHDDVAVGAPGESIGDSASAGAVHVVMGAPTGLTGSQLTLRQGGTTTSSTIALLGSAETGDHLGASVTVGDFDDDGYDDLAIGAPGESVGVYDDAGLVHVLFGSVAGLDPAGQRWLYQHGIADPTSVLLTGLAEPGDLVGAALAAGDYNGDGIDDLAIGAPGESAGTTIGLNEETGIVFVVLGGPGGPSRMLPRFWQGSSLPGDGLPGDRFGAALAFGDINGDGYDDLAIGTPGKPFFVSSGLVYLAYGGANGVSAQQLQIGQGPGRKQVTLAGSPEPGDFLGASLAFGDVDGDGYDDLAIGVPGEAIGTDDDAGLVHIVHGTPGWLYYTDRRVIAQGITTQPAHLVLTGTHEPSDNLGASLTFGDTNGDGYDDLAIGVPGEAIGTDDDAGLVHLLPGSPTGLTTSGQRVIAQGITTQPAHIVLAGANEPDDLTGHAITTGDIDGDGHDDLIITTPGETIGTTPAAGRIDLVPGSTYGPTATGQQRLAQGIPPQPGAITLIGSHEANDFLGGLPIGRLRALVPWTCCRQLPPVRL